MQVRLADGRAGRLTAPFPGCRGDGDWCGIFLDDGSEANIRPASVASVFDKSGWRSLGGRVAAPTPDKTVVYAVEFRNHGTDRMSAKVSKGDGSEPVESRDLDLVAELLNAIVAFEANARVEPERETTAPESPSL